MVSEPALCVLAKALYHIIDKKKDYSTAFAQLTLPGADGLGYNLVELFPVLGHISSLCDALARRKVPEEVIYDTLSFLRLSLPEILKREKPRFGETEFAYFPIYLHTDNLWIGRLWIEIHPNADRNVAVFANKSGILCLLMRDTQLHAKRNCLGTIGFTDEAGRMWFRSF